jgi:hypothetical protein
VESVRGGVIAIVDDPEGNPLRGRRDRRYRETVCPKT